MNTVPAEISCAPVSHTVQNSTVIYDFADLPQLTFAANFALCADLSTVS
jgi:hypothetical protein